MISKRSSAVSYTRKNSFDKNIYIPPQDKVFEDSFIQKYTVSQYNDKTEDNEISNIQSKPKLQMSQAIRKENNKTVWYIGLIFGLIVIVIIAGLLVFLNKSKLQKQSKEQQNQQQSYMNIDSHLKTHQRHLSNSQFCNNVNNVKECQYKTHNNYNKEKKRSNHIYSHKKAPFFNI